MSQSRDFTKDEAAKALFVSVDTLDAWARLGLGPAFVEIATPEGPHRAYPVAALNRFIQDHTVMPPSGAASRRPPSGASRAVVLGGVFPIPPARA